ncbi:MAG: hypothetical protein ACOC7U_05975 [Spirochaetota bacterium]
MLPGRLEDRKEMLMKNLDQMKKFYLQLMVVKDMEQQAYESGNYKHLYELSQNERLLVQDINSSIKHVVPDLLYLRKDSQVKFMMSEIDRLQDTLIRRCLDLRKNIEKCMDHTRKEIEKLSDSPKPTCFSVPGIVSLRA